MNKPWNIMNRWLLSAAVLATFTACQRTAPIAPMPEDDGFLKKDGPVLMLHGKPFYEISFNKFDLFWQMLAAEFGRGGFGPHPAASAEKALKDLNGLGFNTLRVFCTSSPDYFDPVKRPRFLAAMDRMLDLCDKYDIRLVFCLGNCEPPYATECGEEFTDLICREESASRRKMRQYVKEMVLRYRNRRTIAMWEHGNELLLKADIGGRSREWNKMKIPTLEEIARFHTQEAAFIRSLDTGHPITTGDSYRNGLWTLFQFGQGKSETMWAVDTMADIGRAVAMAQKPVDVFCIHNYYHSFAYGCHEVKGPDGKLAAVNLGDWTRIAHAEGKPLYIGEYSATPVARTEAQKKFWAENPEWFESYEGPDREKAEKVVQIALEQILAAKPNLTHWWCYQSDRDMDQKNPQRFDIDLERTPELVRLVADANRRLQMATMGFSYMKTNVSEKGK